MRASLRRLLLGLALFVAAALPAATGRAASTAPPLPPGCATRNASQVAPAYLAVNDPCLGASAAKGDGRMAPATFHMVSGSPTLYLDHTAAIDVTATIGANSNSLSITPKIARQDWTSTTGETYEIVVPGVFDALTVATNEAASVASASFTGNISGSVLTVTNVSSGTIAPNMLLQDAAGNVVNGTEVLSDGTGSGGAGTYNLSITYQGAVASEAMTVANNAVTSASASNLNMGQMVKDTTASGALPAGTLVLNVVGTTIYFTNPIGGSGIGSGDTITYSLNQAYSISSVSSDGGTITLGSNGTEALTSVPVTLVVYPSSYTYTALRQASTVVTMTDSFWRHASCSIAAGSTILNCAAQYPNFNGAWTAGNWLVGRDATPGFSVQPLNGQRMPILIHDDSGNCADFVGQIYSTNYWQAVLDRAPTCSISASNQTDVYWGVVASPKYHGPGYNGSLTLWPGANIEVPAVGSGLTISSPKYLETSVSADIDYLSVTLAANAGATPAKVPVASYLEWGTDDTAAVVAAGTLVTGPDNPGYRYVYWPPGIDTFMASASQNNGSQYTPYATTACGEGRIVWPKQFDWALNTASCAGGVTWSPRQDLYPTQSLKQARATAMSASPTFAVIGDSWVATNSCQAGVFGCADSAIQRAIRDQNQVEVPTIFNWAIGGATLGCLDPLGPTCGYGAGLPGLAATSRPDFYQANTSEQWLAYPEGSSPAVDTFVMRMGANDGYDFPVGGFIDLIAYTQTASWHSSASRYPDWVIVTGRNSGNGTATNTYSLSQMWGQYAVAGLERSMVRSSWFNTIMANNGGSVGLVDLDDVTAEAEEGWSPVRTPPTFALGLAGSNGVGTVTPQTSLPYYWQTPTWGGWSMFYELAQSGTVSLSTFWANLGGGVCHLVGNGAAFTPQLEGTQTGANTTGYPGGALCVDLNSNSHLSISRYLYRFVETVSGCTFTAATNSTLSCPTSIANYGHANASVWVCGTGVGSTTGPAFLGALTDCVNGTLKPGSGTGNGVLTNGEVLTFTADIGVTAGPESMTIMLYLEQPGDPTDTGCTPTVTTSGSETYEPLWFYVRDNGDVGVSEMIYQTPANGAYPFEEQGERCQWHGRMAGFFENPMFPELFTEDNTTHNSVFTFGVWAGGGANSGALTEQVPAFEELPGSARITPLINAAESWGLIPATSSYGAGTSTYGGLGNQHTSTLGVSDIYERALDAEGWNAQ